MNKPIKYAGIAGIISFILEIPKRFIENTYVSIHFTHSLESSHNFHSILYIFNFLAWIIFYTLFIYGFKLLGEKYQNNWLKTASYILMVSLVVYHLYLFSFLVLKLSDIYSNIYLWLSGIFSIINIIFGISLLTLKKQFGALSITAGILKIIDDKNLLSIISWPIIVSESPISEFIMWFIIFLFLIPFYILPAVMILFKASREVEKFLKIIKPAYVLLSNLT